MKKNLLTLFCCIFVFISTVVALMFVFCAEKQPVTENYASVLKGDWIIAGSYNNNTYTPVGDQFAQFSENEVSITEGTKQKTTRYTVNEENELILNDNSNVYKISPKTENCICLFDSQTTGLLLVRSNNIQDPQYVTSEFLVGKWNVVLKGSDLNNGDVLVFEENSMQYFKSNSDTPIAQSNIVIENNILSAKSINMTMNCYKSDDNTMILIENNGNVWEIIRN